MRTLRLIWGSFLVSLVIFGVILVVAPNADADAESTLPLALVGMAFMECIMLGVMRFSLMGSSLGLFTPQDLREPARVEGEELDKAIGAVAGRYQTGSLVGFALAESVALFGFVSSFVTADLLWYGVHASLAVLLMVVQFPRMAGLVGMLKPAERQGYRAL